MILYKLPNYKAPSDDSWIWTDESKRNRQSDHGHF